MNNPEAPRQNICRSMKKFLSLLVLTLSLTQVPALAADHVGLNLVQETEASGIYDIWAAPDAIKIKSRSNGYVVVAQAPTWLVKVWRDDRKQYGQLPFGDFMKGDLLVNNRISYLADCRTPTSTARSTRGVDKLLIYHFPPVEAVSGAGIFVSDRKDGNDVLSGEKLYPELITFDNGFAPQTAQILCRIYNLPYHKGFPIAASNELPNKGSSTLLNCKILSRKAVFKDNQLMPPANYKKVPITKAMFFTQGQADILNEMTGGKL